MASLCLYQMYISQLILYVIWYNLYMLVCVCVYVCVCVCVCVCVIFLFSCSVCYLFICISLQFGGIKIPIITVALEEFPSIEVPRWQVWTQRRWRTLALSECTARSGLPALFNCFHSIVIVVFGGNQTMHSWKS